MELDKTPYKSGLTEFLSKFAYKTQLVIPVYQRNYTWSVNDQVVPFLDDVEKVINGDFNNHFMGIIIYNVTKLSAIFGNEYSIIDGQQRITTTIILLYAIRDLLIESGNEATATKVENTYLCNSDLDDDMKLKLKPLVSDDYALQKIVNKQIFTFDEKDRNSNVYKNYCKIKEWLNDLMNTYSIDDILRAINQLYIVVVPVDNKDYPQKIFESINSKGVPLNSSDLIRNYIFMGLDNNTQENYYTKYWKEIEKNISSDSKKLEEFLRFYITSQTYKLPSTKNNGVYHAFKELLEKRYDNKVNDLENITEAIESILRHSKYYRTIFYAPLSEINPNIRDSLKEYRNIDSNMPSPFLLKVFDLNSTKNEFQTQKISDSGLSSLIYVTTNYLMRRSLSNLDTSDVTRLFAPLTREVINESKTIGFDKIVEIYKKYLINKNQGKGSECPDDSKLKDYVLSNSNMYILKTTRILLDKIELFGNPAPVDLSKLSVEHLMPQTASKEWLEYLNCKEEDYTNYLNRLGNLTLASKVDNSKMSNNPFTYKQEILSDTNHLNLNKEILQKDNWKFKEIDERTNELIKKINVLYPYQTASNAVLNKKAIYLKCENILAEALYDEDTHNVEILPGSTMKKSDIQYSIDSQNQRLSELIDDGIIVEEDANYVFKKDYTFYPQGNLTALSTSASFLLHGSRNGWDLWTTIDDIKLSVFYKHGLNDDENAIQDVIDNYWEKINYEILIHGEKYQKREDYHRKSFNFNLRKKYHGFIDFFDISENTIKFGLWFDDKNKGFFELKHDIESKGNKNNYLFVENETSAFIYLKEQMPDFDEEDSKNELVKKIYQKVDEVIEYAKSIVD